MLVRKLSVPIAALALLLCLGIPAEAERNGEGDLVVSFDGDLNPTRLPRQARAPVAVRVAGNIETVDGDPAQLPQLRTITVGINRQGRLFDRGLPVCDVATIQPATEAAARRLCGGAIIGNGHVAVQVHIPTQSTFIAEAKLLAFNGPRPDGHKLILAQAYGRAPPGAFILSFRVSRRRGTFGNVLTTTLPRSARKWAYLTHFDLTLHRIYRYRGRRRSYVSAACAAPAGFHSALFPFARATYGFVGGQSLTTTVSRTCRVAG